MGFTRQASELAAETSEDRNRYVDFLRALAIIAVVVGHWLAIDVQYEDGSIVGRNALGEASWIHWGTWAFQVIPIFFLVGGWANAGSWRDHRESGRDWASWLRRRGLRLMWPTAVFVTTGLVLTPVAAFLDVSEPILDQASWAVTIILWFVAAYMLIAAITPLSIRAHDRWGLGFVVAIVAVVAATDAVRFVAGSETLAYANYALVWAAFHQIGFAWRDGLVPSGRKPFYLAASASALLVALVAWGPYPVSMVGVPGAEIQNTGPPTLALLTHGLALIGIALALRRWIKRWLERSRVWTAVASANLAIMSIFLWHVVPVVLLASVFAAFEFSLPGPSEASEWLAYRPIWVIMLAALLIPIVLIVRLVERPPEWLESLANRHGRSGVTLAAGLVGVTAASAGLARLAVVGFWVGEPTLVPVWEAIAFLGGFAVAVGAGVLGDHA